MLSASRRRAPFGRALYLSLACCLSLGQITTLHAAANAADVSDELLGLCSSDTLPQDIRGSLSRNFATWKIQEPNDLSVRARTRWGSERPLTCPGIAAGHFKDAKTSSYAVLLIPADHSSGAYTLLVYTQQSGQQYYGFKAVTEGDSGASEVFINSVPTSRFFDANTKPAIKSKAGEAIMLVDSAVTEAYLYVWADLSYEREQVNYQ